MVNGSWLVELCSITGSTEFNTCSTPVDFCLALASLFSFLASAEALPALDLAVELL